MLSMAHTMCACGAFTLLLHHCRGLSARQWRTAAVSAYRLLQHWWKGWSLQRCGDRTHLR